MFEQETPRTPMRPAARKSTVRRSGVGTGTTSLLMIFTVLCFATLAMLSLSTAATQQRIVARGTHTSGAIAQARGVAAQMLAGLDEGLAPLQQAARTAGPAAQPYPQQALQLAESLGWEADAEAGTARLVLPVDAETVLITTVAFGPAEDDYRYQLRGQYTQPAGGWQPEGGGELWVP